MGLLTLLENYKYYDKPEGQDPFTKIIATSKYGFVFGMFAGLHDSVCISQTATVARTINCFAYSVVPLTSLCAVWSSTVFIVSSMRENKDSPWNYAAGVLACTPILHRVIPLGGGGATFFTVSFLSLFAIIYKYQQNQGLRLRMIRTIG